MPPVLAFVGTAGPCRTRGERRPAVTTRNTGTKSDGFTAAERQALAERVLH